jgi:hypothetical protein
MSDFGKNDLAAFDRDAQGFPPQEKQRGWWSRNWLWFVPTLLLTLIILCCGCPAGIIYWGFNKALDEVYKLPVFQEAMKTIETDPQVKKEIGEPIVIVRCPPPSFRIEQGDGRGEADVRWEIDGSKGRAKAHLTARLTGDKWETVILEVVLPSGKKVSLLTEGEGEDKAPLFEGAKPNPMPTENNKPGPEIKMPIPGDIPEAPEKP